MSKFQVTYEIITDESAAEGDVAEYGWVTKRITLVPSAYRNEIDASCIAMSLREAIRLMGVMQDNGNGRSFTDVDPERNPYDGSEVYYTLHLPDNVTQASYARIARLLKAKGLLV